MASCEKIALTGLLVAFWCLSACSSKGSDPDAVANGFVDAYYIEFDLTRAKSFAVGGATRRIEEEEELVEQARKQVQVESRKARVYYDAPTKRQVEAGMVHYTYELDIRQADARVRRKAIVMVAKRNGAWKVVRFREDHGRRPSLRAATSTVTAP